ncbi:putative inositol monophosphatase [Parvularcula bermudensis HTCC2503]|uniref:Putative inositol monophosphatase n=1 Tax=Parvularcula bermudensis (strain ATCC BAA-594 / HTCC2503 / KCTC 12087) TaxID=314260 RepID=E0TDR4_PARBH|nr:inositol monophosphatase [Parvularcula bermudensis]ADM09980.1 putative inositol monophosphatase [Parvularcula bermudensis HTCC2503]
MTPSLIETVDHLLREASADFVLPRFQSLSAADIETKSGPNDLVTVADREAEAWLTPRLAALVPGSTVIGEEAVAADPARLRHLETAGPVWLVDPVDGTANFVKGQPQFGLMVALIDEGVTKAGFIFAPIEDAMAVAIKGEGARLNGAPLSARPQRQFSEAVGDYSSRYVRAPLRQKLTCAVERAQATRQGHCSAYAYLDTARGKIDFVLQYLMNPWDHAAGALLVEEAGGAVRFLQDGRPYTPENRAPEAMLAVGVAEDWSDYSECLK